MPIQLLPDDVISQIAAGEVVERPASVVKELVENALDAGAKSIQIIIEGAGRRLIEVADDGCGIEAGELQLAIARHATSKLERADDLFRIATLGFRGEALASIGSVSHLTIISRRKDSEVGATVRVEGGFSGKVEAASAAVGTVVRIEDLFYNVPARLKFLKQDQTERQQIDALVTRYALAYPGVRWRLSQDGRLALQTSGNSDRREVLAALYGVDVARQMLEVSMASENGLQLSGFTSPVALTRSNRREITFFINGRWVQDISLSTALLQAYHTLLMVGRYPIALLNVQIPPDMVDVNVHPAKAEVRFREPDAVFSLVQRGVRRALLASSPVSQFAQPAWSSRSAQPQPPRLISPDWDMAAGPEKDAAGNEHNEIPSQPTGLPTAAAENPPVSAPVLPGISSSRLPILRLIGQVGGTYLIAEGPDGLYLIDQHAAHERILFERFMAHGTAGLSSQILLHPATVQLSPQGARLLTDQLPALKHLGFEVEPFGQHTFLVRAIPNLITGSDPVMALRALVEDFEEDETPLQAEIEARVAARICKRVAVKGGQTLAPEEQRALLTDLENCQSPRTCPHGRPTMIHISADVLERQFGRRGAR
ncbi:MAG TPA: DNA mismatch repair endonuclease MutL [Anaerolineaceae bacterium]|nr:DNA mismatch repair endonuclease MutL [Anaerolineaceae bacterium]HPN52725.1 DNA mismatch repair endonuclease MutL [Anaerolineaceae bacterium]